VPPLNLTIYRDPRLCQRLASTFSCSGMLGFTAATRPAVEGGAEPSRLLAGPQGLKAPDHLEFVVAHVDHQRWPLEHRLDKLAAGLFPGFRAADQHAVQAEAGLRGGEPVKKDPRRGAVRRLPDNGTDDDITVPCRRSFEKV
jgi:hypothetical protein